MVGFKDINMIREKFQIIPKVKVFHELELMYVQILIVTALPTVACIIIVSFFFRNALTRDQEVIWHKGEIIVEKKLKRYVHSFQCIPCEQAVICNYHHMQLV